MAVRIANSTASRPPPAPSDRAARAARRSTSAVTSAASAWQSPPFLRPAGRGLTSSRRDRPGLADRLVHLHDLLGKLRELLVARQLGPDLLQLGGSELAGARLAAHRAGPQPSRPVARMARPGTGAIRLAAAAVGGVDAARPQVVAAASLSYSCARCCSSSGRDGSVIRGSSGSLNTSRLSSYTAPSLTPYFGVAHPTLRHRWPVIAKKTSSSDGCITTSSTMMLT